MTSWGGVYYLKEDTKVVDIWNCVRELLKECFPVLPEPPPKNVFFETDNEVLFWNCSREENELVELRFTKRLDNKKNTIRIVFDKKLKSKKHGHVHMLFYKEIAENENLFFCWRFFPIIKKHVPKAYSKIKITDDRQKIKQLLLKFPSLLKCLKSKELETFLRHFYSLENEYQKIESSLFSSEYPTIKFRANESGEFFLSSDLIEKLADDLWFTKAKILKSYGIISAINRENLLKIHPELKKKEKATKKNALSKKEFDDNINKLIDELRNKFIDEDKKIFHGCCDIGLEIVENYGNECRVKSVQNVNIFDAKLKNEIICSIDYEYLLNNELRQNMPELLENDKNENRILEQKIDFDLKKMGLDENSLEKIIKENEKLKKENASLIKDIEDKKKETKCKEDEAKKLKQELLKRDGTNVNLLNDNSLNYENPTLKQKIDELKDENKSLKKENSSLNDRIKSLENKKIKSDCKYYTIKIPCSKKELFIDEIKDYLYDRLYNGIESDKKNLSKDKEKEVLRKRDVIEALIEEKEWELTSSETKHKFERIKNVIIQEPTNMEALEREGFKEIENNNHTKSCFYEERYKIIFSRTPSDKRTSDKMLKDIKCICFLL